MSGYLGSIGFSFPATMGASAATQEHGKISKDQRAPGSGPCGRGRCTTPRSTGTRASVVLSDVSLI